MRIGIDASRAFLKERTGTEEYSYQLITHMLQLPEAWSHTWILYVRPNSQFPIYNFQSNSNFKFQIINLPHLWTQVGLAARTWIDNLDVLWIPAHTLPVLRNPWLKTVVTVHGIEYEWLPAFENPLQRWYLPLSTQCAVRNATKIIAVSHFTKKQLVQRLHADAKKIVVIHEGVSNLGGRRKWGVLKKYGLLPNQYLLFIGTVQPRKNLVRLIKAFSSLSTPTASPPTTKDAKQGFDLGGDREGVKLVIVGKLGWGYQEVLDEIANSPIKDHIVTLGYINDIERDTLLHNALVYVQPSITEGFGLPVLQAFAAGIPVVSSNGGALKEIINIQYSIADKILFDPYNVKDMVVKIALVLADAKLRQKMIKEGQVNKFSWQKAAQETYNILTNV